MSELEVYEAQESPQIGGVLSVRDPAAMLEQATNLANQLKDVVQKAGLVSKISGKDYLTVEAWTTLGVLVGCTARTEWTRQVEGGWEAAVEVVNQHGLVVGRAEASCMREERNWKNRDEYALRSMAQTRAMGKALRMPLGWIAALAGYQPTPAEEIPVVEVRTDGHEPAGSAKNFSDWVKRMAALEVDNPEGWAANAIEAAGLAGKKGPERMQRLNRVLLTLSDTEPASSLGFWDRSEIQAAFALAFDGVLVDAPEKIVAEPAEEAP